MTLVSSSFHRSDEPFLFLALFFLACIFLLLIGSVLRRMVVENCFFDDLTMQGVLSEVAFDCSGQPVLVAGDFTLDPYSILCFLDAPQVGGVPQITLGALPSALCHGDCVG